MSMDVSVNVPQLGKMAQATRRDERLMEKIAANATSADTVVNPEVGRLRVEVESLKAELEHWRTCAERWHTTARANARTTRR